MNYTEKILEEASMIIEETITDKYLFVRINPTIASIISLTMAFLVAFTNNHFLILSSIPLLLAMYLLLPINNGYFLKILLIITIIGTIPALPVIFTSTGYINTISDVVFQPTITGLEKFSLFSLRVIISSIFFILPIIGLGWYGFLKSLSKIKPLQTFFSLITLVIVVIPRITRNMLSIMFAREARIISRNYRALWRSISSTIGDTIILSYSYAGKLTKAITARTMGPTFYYNLCVHRHKYSFIDLLLIIGTIVYTSLYLLVEMSWIKLY